MNLFAILYGNMSLLVVIDNPQRDANVCAIEEVPWQDYDGLNQFILDELAADGQLCTIGTQGAVGKDEAGNTVLRELGHHIENPGIVGVGGRRNLVTCPTRIVAQLVLLTPVLLVERRIGHDEVGFETLMLVVVESVGLLLSQVAGNSADGEVHLGQLVGGLGVFLAVNGNIFLVAVVALDKLETLHEHTAGAAARVIDLAFEGLNHLRYEIDDALRGVEFALSFAFSDGKLGEEVFVHAANEVVLLVLEGINLIDLVQERCQLGDVKAQVGVVVVRKSALQGFVLAFNL